jgi:hypothetical protein
MHCLSITYASHYSEEADMQKTRQQAAKKGGK